MLLKSFKYKVKKKKKKKKVLTNFTINFRQITYADILTLPVGVTEHKPINTYSHTNDQNKSKNKKPQKTQIFGHYEIIPFLYQNPIYFIEISRSFPHFPNDNKLKD